MNDLTESDYTFINDISKNYEVPFDKMERYLSDLKEYLEKYSALVNIPLAGISYNGPLMSREGGEFDFLYKITIEFIYDHWELPKFRKYIIAALAIKHFKLDKYKRIMSEEDYTASPTESSQDYKHYIYHRIRSRFKKLE